MRNEKNKSMQRDDDVSPVLYHVTLIMKRETTNMEEATKIWCQSLETLAHQLSETAKEIRADETDNDFSNVVVDTNDLLERIKSLESASECIQKTFHSLTDKRMVIEASINAINKENEAYIEALKKQNAS